MRREKILAFGNTLAFAITIAANALANLLPINGLNTGAVSNLYPSLFTPAGITFSIWSVIYFLLMGFVIIQWRYKQEIYFSKLSMWFIISCLLNASWIFSWHYLIVWLSVALMIGLLFSLVQIFLLMQNVPVGNRLELIFFKQPFTLYLAWICVATIANISAYLVSQSWHGGAISESGWTILMMVVAVALVIIFLRNFRAYGFALVVMWAFFGIAIKHLPLITQAAIALMVATAIATFITYVKSKREAS